MSGLDIYMKILLFFLVAPANQRKNFKKLLFSSGGMEIIRVNNILLFSDDKVRRVCERTPQKQKVIKFIYELNREFLICLLFSLVLI